jgi:hypothetical protein
MRKLLFLAVLSGAVLFASAADARSLRKGMSGNDVRQWQSFLKSRGAKLTPYGKFDSATESATILFQKKWKLTGDGIVDSKTIEKARSLGFKPVSNKAPKPVDDKASKPVKKPNPAATRKNIGKEFPYTGLWTDQNGGVLQIDKEVGLHVHLEESSEEVSRWWVEERPRKTLVVECRGINYILEYSGIVYVHRFIPHDNGVKMEVQTEYTFEATGVTVRNRRFLTRQWSD